MKTFFTTKQPFLKATHPQEDFLFFSNRYPIFVVADGVTLNPGKGKRYPKKSGAFEAAKIFCQAVVSETEKRYENFKEKDLLEIFRAGNSDVRQYNISQGRTKRTINYFDVDLFSTTASFALIKNKKVYWFSLCDAAVAHFNKRGKRLFTSAGCWDICRGYLPKNWQEFSEKEKLIALHKNYRNKISQSGQLIGYGVINGEESAEFYLNKGVLKIKIGDLLFLYTDGFENYFKLKKFVELFKLWPENIDRELNKLIAKKSKQNLRKFGAEKTLIAIAI